MSKLKDFYFSVVKIFIDHFYHFLNLKINKYIINRYKKNNTKHKMIVHCFDLQDKEIQTILFTFQK